MRAPYICNMPQAVTVKFGGHQWDRLLDVLVASWEKNASIPLKVIREHPPELGRRHQGIYNNTHKLEIWLDYFTEDTIFIDADMLCLGCPSGGFESVEYAGITRRDGKLPFNGGVMYVRHNRKGKAFMKDLKEINDKMLEDADFHTPYRKKYAGINQSAIGYLKETKYNDITMLDKRWNLTEPWNGWENANMIHIKGHLRKTCLRDRINPPEPQKSIKKIWKSFERSKFWKL